MPIGNQDDERRLRRLVKSRSAIQESTLEILRVMRHIGQSKDVSASIKLKMSLLVGVAFSLWRAVFLTHDNQGLEENLADAEAFLVKVLKHNTADHFDDASMGGWAFSYHLNNAHLRLVLLGTKMPLLRQTLTVHGQWQLDAELARTENTDSQDLWDIHHKIFTSAIELLLDELAAAEVK
jgi:hypothetical protein